MLSTTKRIAIVLAAWLVAAAIWVASVELQLANHACSSAVLSSSGGIAASYSSAQVTVLFDANFTVAGTVRTISPCVAVSEDGSLIATAAEHSVSVFDVRSGALLSTVTLGRIAGHSICRHPFGLSVEGVLVCLHDNGEVGLYGPAQDDELRILPKYGIWSFALSGSKLVTGHASGEVISWDVKTGQHESRLGKMPGRVKSLMFSPCGTMIVAASGWPGSGGQVAMWHSQNGTAACTIEIDEHSFSYATLNHSCTHLLTGVARSTGGNETLVYSLSPDKLSAQKEFHWDNAEPIAFASDGKHIVMAVPSHERGHMLSQHSLDGKDLGVPAGPFVDYDSNANGRNIIAVDSKIRCVQMPKHRVDDIPEISICNWPAIFARGGLVTVGLAAMLLIHWLTKVVL